MGGCIGCSFLYADGHTRWNFFLGNPAELNATECNVSGGFVCPCVIYPNLQNTLRWVHLWLKSAVRTSSNALIMCRALCVFGRSCPMRFGRLAWLSRVLLCPLFRAIHTLEADFRYFAFLSRGGRLFFLTPICQFELLHPQPSFTAGRRVCRKVRRRMLRVCNT